MGDLQRLAPINSVVSNPQELAALPIRTGNGPTVFVRDVGRVELGSDILTGYGLINERRTVYIPVTKRAEASTLDVVNRVKAEVPNFQKLIPDDIKVGFEFDQSQYVKNSVRGLALEGALGALLTGLMVLLFLRDFRSALIVVITIPIALLAALVGLWLAGQTVNIMTLGGLALAIGILVDESTVAIENIHTHLSRGEPKAQAVLDATRETITPRLLAMLSILAVFVPSFLMVGVSRSLFVPLSLAVGFAMLASYFLSNTLVPILAVWWLKEERPEYRLQANERTNTPPEGGTLNVLESLMKMRWVVLCCYILIASLTLVFIGRKLGTDIFPNVDTGSFSLRLRAPSGTRVERTEVIALNVLKTIREEAKGQVEITISYVGTQPASFPVNTIHQWTRGPHEAILLVKLKSGSGIHLNEFKERLREKLPKVAPNTSLSFEAGDIVTQVMNFGAPTPIEVALSGANLTANRGFADKVLAEMKKIPTLRDLQFAQPLDYPTVNINIDRERAGQMGLTIDQIGRSMVAATSSSRFTQPNYWRDPASGVAYQVQVEVPQSRMSSIEDIQGIPVNNSKGSSTLLGDVASVNFGSMQGEYDRYNQARMLTITGNIQGADLGSVSAAVNEAIKRAGEIPKGVNVNVRGQVPAMQSTLTSLGTGLLLAIVTIFLLLAGYFQSIRIALITVAAVPAVLSGVAIALWITGTTLNVQSFMGGIMAIGVSTANAILLVTFAEQARQKSQDSVAAAIEAAKTRLRPILMTTFAMIAGMIPMALALGEGGEQTAPLGRAVIGGLIASTIAVLFILPLIFAMSQRKASKNSASLHPEEF